MSSSKDRQTLFQKYRERWYDVDTSAALLREIINEAYYAGENHIRTFIINQINNQAYH